MQARVHFNAACFGRVHALGREPASPTFGVVAHGPPYGRRPFAAVGQGSVDPKGRLRP